MAEDAKPRPKHDYQLPVPDTDKYTPQWGCLVLCDSEVHQAEVYDKLSELGFNVRVVTV
jgi:hypothetical protein